MLGRMFAGRVIAAANVPALHTHAQVHPLHASLQAFLAAIGSCLHILDHVEMRALICHKVFLAHNLRCSASAFTDASSVIGCASERSTIAGSFRPCPVRTHTMRCPR